VQPWSPFGPPIAPAGVPIQTVPAYAPPGYAATAPTQAETGGVTGPGEAPPGFAWAAFDPGGEMFGLSGLGALKPTLNPTLQGGMIEEGWDISGPNDAGSYTIRRPNGQGFGTYTEDQLFQGVVRDPSSNSIVFVPPSSRPTSSASEITGEVASTLREVIRGVASVMTAQERRRAARYGAAPTGGTPVLSTGATTGRSSGMPSVVWVGLGVLGAGAVVAVLTRRKKGKE